MPDLVLFVEDFAHQEVIGALVRRLAADLGLEVRLEWRSARHGYGRVVQEFKEYLRNFERQRVPVPDLIVVATDANCHGLNERTREIGNPDAPARLVLAIPDPHVERWLLLDGAAFKNVFGRGCDAPDQKCDRDRYKQRLVHAIFASGVTPNLGGLEFAEDIVQCMDIERAEQTDESFRRFTSSLRNALRNWQP